MGEGRGGVEFVSYKSTLYSLITPPPPLSQNLSHELVDCKAHKVHRSIKMLEDLPGPKPAVNQIEFQPWYQQRPVSDYCLAREILIVAFCPLVRSDARRMNDPVVLDIAKRHGKDVGQVLLRWSLQNG